MKYFLVYFAVISLITAIVTVKDKAAAKKGGWRVSEATLFLLALLGGSIAEYAVMKRIRHKTRHKRFMWGLPLIIILQTAVFCLFILYPYIISQ